MSTGPSFNAPRGVHELFSLFIRGEVDSLNTGTTCKEYVVANLWGSTAPLPVIDCEILELPSGATYGDGMKKFVAAVWPASVAYLEALEADVLRRCRKEN